jgi:signal transduction histidine kinase/ActR/RegA family two-component response regulator
MPEAAPSEGLSEKRAKDEQARVAHIRLLHVMAAAALLLPLLLFCFASWASYRSTQELADERIARALDVMQEEALKTFQSMTLALDTIETVLGDRSADEIRADEQRLHEQLRQIQRALPDVQSIWIFGPDGRPQVITREYPAPSLSYADEDYFREPRDGAPGIHIGAIHQSVSGGQPYFSFNRARRDRDGKFLGVIEMSLLPSDFVRFYSQLTNTPGMTFELLREDGTVLARSPPRSTPRRLDDASRFRRAIAASPAGGVFASRSRVDGRQRRFAYRKLPSLPLYVVAGVSAVETDREWMSGMALHLIFGVPATAFLFGAVVVVLQRTRRLYAEQDRREQAEATVRQTQRLDAVGRLTGGVAHDFNNLLTIILGNLSTIQRILDRSTDDASLNAAKAKLERAGANAMLGAKRAATLTQRLLAFARLHPLEPRPLDVNRLLNDFSSFLSRTIGETIALEVVGAAGLWLVSVDQAQLETALINLSVNARDAMPDGGKLTLETANVYVDDAYRRLNPDVELGQYVLISVTDTGAGMSRDTVEKAFEPFFTTKDAGHGTGLGLSQVYGFVRQSGGHAKIYSEVGEGTTVKIYLPRLVGDAPAQNAVEAAESAPAERGRGERILVVEDDAEVRAYIVEALRELGFEVSEAPDGKQALAVTEGRDLDLLLTDVILPGINGRQLADAMTAQRPGLKVLFMTGYSRNAIVHQGRLDPGVHLLQKPVTSVDLVRKIRELLGAPARAGTMPSDTRSSD